LDALLPTADILVCVLPGTTETVGLVDERRLGLLKRGALVINAGRGATVDNLALAKALEEKRIRAALDVMEPEPLPREHPLWKAPNVMLTPHVAGDSTKFMQRAYELAAEQARRFAAGEPLKNIVTGEY
jgi:phosphoglycerate dehydrogenase-like enzyme